MKRLLCIFISTVCLISSAAFAETTYRFGVVPQFEPRKLAAIWIPILAELEKRTGFHLTMVGAARIPEFESEFENGRYDFAYMNPYHSVVAMRKQGYEPLVRDEGTQLSGILVVTKDGPIKQMSDLAGKTVAFPAPNALGASLLMRADLERIHKLKISPLWSQTHTSAYLNAALGKADAAGGVMATFEQQPPTVRDKLKILYETRTMASHPVMAHPRVLASDREKLRQAFLDMGSTTEGQALLAKVPFKRIGTAKPEDYRELANWGLEDYYVRGSD
jgi:phosphonate transport system substrate-binding protein